MQLGSGDRETLERVLDFKSWQVYSRDEFVELAKVYRAFDLPEIARYLIYQIGDQRMWRATEPWGRWSAPREQQGDFVIQESTN